MVLSIRVCTARGRVHVSAGESFARVCVHMAVCKAGAVLVSSCTWLCKGMGCTHVCVCMNTNACIKVFAQGFWVLHTLACTRMECAHRAVQGCACTCVNAQVCVRRSLCTWVYGSAHIRTHRCACKRAVEAPGNGRYLGAAELPPECWRAQGREAQLRSTALCTTACRTARSADRTRTQRHSRHCKGNSSIPAATVTGRQALGRAARQRDAL